MSDTGRHWKSEELILFGLWLWKIGEYGHAMLSIHAPNWGLKIGEQLKLTWSDVFDIETGVPLAELSMFGGNSKRPIRNVVRENLIEAVKVLDVKDGNSPLYVNSKTGKPLTSSTLNRELQRFAKMFLADIKQQTGLEFDLKEIKTNAFEIAWAKDVTRDNNYIKEIYPLLSRYMGHRTVKDTIALLEEEPGSPHSVQIRFDHIKDNTPLSDGNLWDDKEKLNRFVERYLYLGIEE